MAAQIAAASLRSLQGVNGCENRIEHDRSAFVVPLLPQRTDRVMFRPIAPSTSNLGYQGARLMATQEKHGRVLRILVAHSCPIVQRGIDSIVRQEPGLVVAGHADDGAQTLRSILKMKPDIGIVELDLPDVDGLRVVTSISRQGLPTRILLLSEHCHGRDVYAAMKAGVGGFCGMSETVENILLTIRGTANGRLALSEAAQFALRDYLQQQPVHGPVNEIATATAPLLTGRELQVLRCIAEGISIEGTGARLNMSATTVKNHRHSLLSKLGVSNAPAAVYSGVRCGLLPADSIREAS